MIPEWESALYLPDSPPKHQTCGQDFEVWREIRGPKLGLLCVASQRQGVPLMWSWEGLVVV